MSRSVAGDDLRSRTIPEISSKEYKIFLIEVAWELILSIEQNHAVMQKSFFEGTSPNPYSPERSGPLNFYPTKLGTCLRQKQVESIFLCISKAVVSVFCVG